MTQLEHFTNAITTITAPGSNLAEQLENAVRLVDALWAERCKRYPGKFDEKGWEFIDYSAATCAAPGIGSFEDVDDLGMWASAAACRRYDLAIFKYEEVLCRRTREKLAGIGIGGGYR